MNPPTPTGPTPSKPRRSPCASGATTALLAMLALSGALLTGCGDDLAREFRQAALGSIESGVRSIADGLFDGLFAIAEPDAGETTE
ncbi:MAG: hypothetical protein AB1601_16625 [Planctomycetota bacterium]